ncbi:hypothetical protein [Desertivirga xinjiangensis]|uniref:hypothetical protein n=1 Tax=Desertivirga xinjiangensis TaxID=539206 RepID=UPI00210B8B84|nr:hypothetical protein [Pedobacter xinjiangensis]
MVNFPGVKKAVTLCFILSSIVNELYAQQLQRSADSLVFSSLTVRVVLNTKRGTVDFKFAHANSFNNTMCYIEEVNSGFFRSVDFSSHTAQVREVNDALGKGSIIEITHQGEGKPLRLLQSITVYKDKSFIVASCRAESRTGPIESRNISPFALSADGGRAIVHGRNPRVLDVPFDNDNWVKVLTQSWAKPFSGTGYEFISLYDQDSHSGTVIGSLRHDFWKTGIRYHSSDRFGQLDSLVIFGGASSSDNPRLPAEQGGYDGTHDLVAHGTAIGQAIESPLLFIGSSADVRKVFRDYGDANSAVSGGLKWNKPAPFYWNSFGVENVLGWSKIMMPDGVNAISDTLKKLANFNKQQPVISIDSYDQSIYSTKVLASINSYLQKNNQKIGFYFIPFALWTWKNSISNDKLQGTDYAVADVVLRDDGGNPIAYKDGDWAAYALDPTHPAVRQYVVQQLKKAKTIGATFLKIDFLTAGSLESSRRYDKSVRTGLQAYNQGMKMLKGLVDSVMGPDIFITMAISPMFPHQYAHTRFISTDVYSHLRDDQPGFPHYGSTASSMITASHMTWTQGTLWPYTNMDVLIMNNFQKNPDLTEQEVKVRLYSMMTMGSIMGDGSDLRNKTASGRAAVYMNNADVCAFFKQPKAFTPLRFADGTVQDQQLSFFLPGNTVLVSVFNFKKDGSFKESFNCSDLGLREGDYEVRDFLTGRVLASIRQGETSFSLVVPQKDAVLAKIVRISK